MKKTFLITIILLSLLVFTGCVKQNNCYCGLSTVSGKFVFYENGKEIFYCTQEQTVTAVIIQDITEIPFYIIGSVPKKYQMTDTVFVITCLDEVKNNGCLALGENRIFKLKCIEEHP